jgi:hypothetical protein
MTPASLPQLDSPVPGVFGPLDALRSAVLRIVGGPGRRLLGDRDLRVVAYAVFSLTSALVLTLVWPMGLLALGPIVLGVPHLLADARYMVVRQGMHRRLDVWLLVFAPIAITWYRPTVFLGLFGLLGAVLCARASMAKRAIGFCVWAALAIPAFLSPRWAAILFAHGHNVVAVLIWFAWTGARSRLRAGVVVLFFAVLLFLLFAPIFPVVFGAGGLEATFGLTLDSQLRALAPPGVDANFALRLTLAFAFAQSVHYAVWLRLLPEDDRPRSGIRSFSSSYRALRADVGTAVIGVFSALFVGLLAWAIVDLVSARLGYLKVAIVHGHLELAVCALLLLERRPGGESPRTVSTPLPSNASPEPIQGVLK